MTFSLVIIRNYPSKSSTLDWAAIISIVIAVIIYLLSEQHSKARHKHETEVNVVRDAILLYNKVHLLLSYFRSMVDVTKKPVTSDEVSDALEKIKISLYNSGSDAWLADIEAFLLMLGRSLETYPNDLVYNALNKIKTNYDSCIDLLFLQEPPLSEWDAWKLKIEKLHLSNADLFIDLRKILRTTYKISL